MARKPCQCGSNCAEIGCLDCCDCGAPIAGPLEKALRSAALADVGAGRLSHGAYALLLGAVDSLRRGWNCSRAEADNDATLPDVLSEAIEAAEALGL